MSMDITSVNNNSNTTNAKSTIFKQKVKEIIINFRERFKQNNSQNKVSDVSVADLKAMEEEVDRLAKEYGIRKVEKNTSHSDGKTKTVQYGNNYVEFNLLNEGDKNKTVSITVNNEEEQVHANIGTNESLKGYDLNNFSYIKTRNGETEEVVEYSSNISNGRVQILESSSKKDEKGSYEVQSRTFESK